MFKRYPSWKSIIDNHPLGWKVRALGDLFVERNEIAGHELPLLSVTASQGVVYRHSLKRRDTSSEDKSKYKTVRWGDIVYNTMRMWQGVSSLARIEGIVSPAYTVITPRVGADAEFFSYLLKLPPLVSVFKARSQGLVDDTLSLRFSEFARIVVCVPTLMEQTRMAAILSSIDDNIEQVEAVIDGLRSIRSILVDQLIDGNLPSAGLRTASGMPGWCTTKIGALGTFSGGKGFGPQDWSTSGLPIIRIQNLNGASEFNYFSGTPNPACIVEPGDLLYAWAGSRGASFGPHIWQGPQGVLNQHIHKIRPNAGVNKEYIYYLLLRITRALEGRAHGFKQSLVHLKKSELTEYVVAIPPLEEQARIVEVLSSIDRSAKTEMDYLSALKDLKKALAFSLLTGELRISLDEAAS